MGGSTPNEVILSLLLAFGWMMLNVGFIWGELSGRIRERWEQKQKEKNHG